MSRRFLALFAACVCILCTHAEALSAQRTLDITSFDADYHVRPNGDLHVTEHITARFSGQWNGLYRQIPVRYRMDNGSDYTVGLRIVSAKDELGHELRREESREGSYLKVKAWIPDAVDTTHTLTLTYVVTDALRFLDEHDELYWNVTGNAWEYPIQSVTARVFLPTGASAIHTAVYTGLEGSTASDNAVTKSGPVSDFATSRPLDLHEGMTIVVGWAPGVVARPTSWSRFMHWMRSNAIMLLPFLTLLIMYLLWRKFGRDPEIGTIVTRYEPPVGMTPAEVGTVIDMSVDNRDIAATLVDLAVRGHLRINEFPREKVFGFSTGNEYSFERSKPYADAGDLKEHERLMISGIFDGHGDLVSMNTLHNSFYTTLAKMKSTLWNAMMKAGYFKQDPKTVRLVYIVIAAAMYFAIRAIGGSFADRYGIGSDTVTVAAVLSALIIFGFGFIMPRRTLRGVQTVREVMGFQEFLSRVDGERIRTVIDRPELFEKYLPYAMALGVDKQWATKFESLSLPQPQWYVGTGNYMGPFRPNAFVGQINHMTSSVSTTFASSPRSSSGSGFSGGGGGGFSGGGFGGGGGGGF